MDILGQEVLITGASKGFGKAMATPYAKAGTSDIAIIDRTDLPNVVKEMERAASEANRSKPKILRIKCIDDCDNAAKQVDRPLAILTLS
ncbi:hypothetical protein LTR70_008209 [Exophiala xenobiotica]|uniref:Uncharacterized protein n=1 Tax=Lithohypha guttulata TaxID=1690604 RepID=A0ABR0K3H3_9EURO|nr:hypothetical protein LTR24_007797 [Lithohypha guttulata]KAK5312367.1 hypothetical protein LTR70_008209 [Exophiala xenobiotica]